MDPVELESENAHQLEYTIHSCSSCSINYHPFNIIDNNPIDPASRWSGSGPPNPSLPKKKDYIIIDLARPCIVRSITFGKFHRPHPCNVKLFRIWGSLAPGEGSGDFKALLDSQSNQSIDQSQSPPNELLQPLPTSSKHKHHLLSNYDLNNSIIKPHNPLQPLQRVRVRGERHRSGPRMELLAQGELKNDAIPETVPLRWKNSNVPWFKSSDPATNPNNAHSAHPNHSSLPSNRSIIVPVRYLKIEPLSASGNYNCSIWHISIKGHDEDHLIQPCLQTYEKWRASAALRLCLKHLRQAGHFEAFQALLKSSTNPSQSPTLVPPCSDSLSNHLSKSAFAHHLDSNASNGLEISSGSAQFHFEHSLVSALHAALVPHSGPRDYSNGRLTSSSVAQIRTAEQIVVQAASEGLFDDWARSEPPTLTCHQIHGRSESTSEVPCPRGGHQMCIDSKRRKLWLFGGFDGYTDLGDLWVYHLGPPDLSAPGEDGSPPPWSLLNEDSSLRETANLRPRPRTCDSGLEKQSNKWQLISRDVKLDNGPINRSCHKMVLDELTGDLYVLGRYSERGRVSGPKAADLAGKPAIANGNPTSNSDRRNTQSGLSSAFALENGSGAGETQLTDSSAESMHRYPADMVRSIVRAWNPPSVPFDPESALAPVSVETDELMSDGEAIEAAPPKLSVPVTGPFSNDLFRYRPFKNPTSEELWDNEGRVGQWECLSRDTYADGGPKLIFDHQMVLDSESRKIYVFGGKIIQPGNSPAQDGPAGSSSRPSVNQYSGLFEYDLSTSTWAELMSDPGSSTLATADSQQPNSSVPIPSRMGNSLILDKKRECLWILSGERDGHYYSDLWKYDIPSGHSELMIGDYTYGGRGRQSIESDGSGSGPEAGFSQRTTFDPEADEWHMFCGLCKDRGTTEATTKASAKSETMSSEFWRWRIDEARWTRVVMMAELDGMDAPPPRFAHQMVFDELTKSHYVFGGNPADNDNEPIRLGDFWRLKLVQPTRQEALRRSLFALRRQHFIELCEEGTDIVGALVYLQNDLSTVTNHLDEQEARLFRACTSHLLAGPGPRLPLLEEEQVSEQMGEDEDSGMEEFEGAQTGARWVDSPAGAAGGPGAGPKQLSEQRTKLFQELLKYFPDSMTEPEESLMDLIDVFGDREMFW